MFYVVNNHLNNLYVLSNKAVGPGKNQKLINVGPTSIPEARVAQLSFTRSKWNLDDFSTVIAHLQRE